MRNESSAHPVMVPTSVKELSNSDARDILAALNLAHGCIREFDGTISFWCEGNEHFYGWRPDEAVGRVSHTLLETRFPKPLNEINAEFREKGSWQGELCHTTKDGGQVWVASHWVLQRDSDGNPRCVIEVNNDVTNEKRNGQRMRYLASIVESSDDAIIGKDLHGIVGSWNGGAERLFGYSREEMVGHSIVRLYPPEIAQKELQILRRIERGEHVHHYETVRIAKSGRRIPVSLSISPVRDENGKVIGASKIGRDISERRNLERAISQSEERQRLAVEAGGVGLWSYDAASRTFQWNSGPKEKFNLRPDAPPLSSEEVLKEIYREDAEWVDCMLESSIDESSGFELDFRVVDNTGSLRWVHAKCRPRLHPDGTVAELNGTVVDFTARKQIEEALKRTNKDLEQFAYAAAHDLQEPLRNVALSVGMARLHLPAELDSEAQDLLQGAVESAHRMEAMVRDLLSYSRMLHVDEGLPDVTDANEALEVSVENLTAAIAESSAKITRDQLPVVRMAKPHLTQLFQNLIGNSLKHRSTEPPEIHIGAELKQHYCEFSVTDNGLGIEPEFQARVFDVFKRLRKRDTPGTGMGLALCKRIVERYGGEIWIRSDGKSGTTFFFTVPCPDRGEYRQ